MNFNLVVSGSSDLVKFGGLSNRQNAQDDEEEVSNGKIDDKKVQFESNDKTNLDLVKEIEKLKKKQELYEKQYSECEKALRRKTEEAERLKTELKDVKLKLSLEYEIRANKETENSSDIENLGEMKNSGFQRTCPSVESSPKTKCTKPCSVSEEEFDCKDCDSKFGTNGRLKKHISRTHSEKIVTCTKCEFQSVTVEGMMKHACPVIQDQEFRYDISEYDFDGQKELDKHIENTHGSKSKRFWREGRRV